VLLLEVTTVTRTKRVEKKLGDVFLQYICTASAKAVYVRTVAVHTRHNCLSEIKKRKILVKNTYIITRGRYINLRSKMDKHQ
jgi:hypothetical protein